MADGTSELHQVMAEVSSADPESTVRGLVVKYELERQNDLKTAEVWKKAKNEDALDPILADRWTILLETRANDSSAVVECLKSAEPRKSDKWEEAAYVLVRDALLQAPLSVRWAADRIYTANMLLKDRSETELKAFSDYTQSKIADPFDKASLALNNAFLFENKK